MAKQGYTCSCCGQKIIQGNSKIFENRTYCLSCYEKIIKEQQELEQVKDNLYKYIKKLFVLQECPSEVIFSIDNLVNQGKTLKGIYATLKFYYEIEGHAAENVIFISKTVKEQYEKAKQYFIKQKEIQERNKEVEVNPPPVVIRMEPPKAQKEKKLKYKMEDL